MQVALTLEQESRLKQLASAKGTDVERLVYDAALHLLDDDAHFREAVRQGLAEADLGKFIEEAEMDARFERLLRG